MTNTTGYLISVVPLTRIPLTRDQAFFYTHKKELQRGVIVRITIGSRELDGIVLSSHKDFARAGGMKLKPIRAVLEYTPLHPEQLDLAAFISRKYYTSLGIVLKSFRVKEIARRKKLPVKPESQTLNLPKVETDICKKLLSKVAPNRSILLTTAHNPFRHEVIAYIIQVLTQNTGQILILVPEKLLVPIYETLLNTFLPQHHITAFTSDLSGGQESEAVKVVQNLSLIHI